MSDTRIAWYSVDADLKTCEHAPVDLERAIALAEEYYARGARKFEGAEEAIAATMFGFSRSKTTFVEFCVNAPSQISYKFESAAPDASFLRRMFGGTYQFEAVLGSRQELIRRVEEFFEATPDVIKARLQGT